MTPEHKARWVKDGHRTPEHECPDFDSVVSKEIARIELTRVALNDLPICAHMLFVVQSFDW